MTKLMTHIVAGYPSLEESYQLARLMVEAPGVSFIEIQIPFSDPVADGPTIAQANQKALEQGITPEDAFQLMERLRTEQVSTPMLFMTYYNIVFSYGVREFCRRAKAAGAYGLIVPDVPYDEDPDFLDACREFNLHPIQVISPLTLEVRLKEIAKIASGFIYCVSQFGSTGAQGIASSLVLNLCDYLDRVRQFTTIPLALGFGITSPSDVESFKSKIDFAVVGSHVLRLYSRGGLEAVRDFLAAWD